MRNIIFTSVLAIAASAAYAQPQGCFSRAYSAEHLAKNPNQTVSRLSVDFDAVDIDEIYTGVAVVRATMAAAETTSEAGIVGRTFDNSLICKLEEKALNVTGNWSKPNSYTCYGECDGGLFQVAKFDGKSMLIRTSYVALGDADCGGEAVLGDDNATGPTTYKLFAAAAQECAP